MLLVGTSHGLRDLESGETPIDGVAVTALAHGGADGLYALLDCRFVVRLDEDMSDAVPVGELPEPDGQSLAVLPDGTEVVGRTGHALPSSAYMARSATCQRSKQCPDGTDGKTRRAPRRTPARWQSAGSGGGSTCTSGGVWWSEDAGETWYGAVEPGADVHEVRAATDGRVAVAAAVGFGWSEDDGDSWCWTRDGLHAPYLRAVALDGDTALVSASDGPFTRSGAVYGSRLGSRFVRCEAGLPESFDGNVDSGHLDAASGRVALGFGDHVYLSEDTGKTWRVAAVFPDAVTAVRFARS